MIDTEDRDRPTAEEANAIYDLLVEDAGAPAAYKDSFVHAHKSRGCYEWRFQGRLGFGGKFWVNAGRWYVSCYSEDLNPKREEIIESVNAKLAVMKAARETSPKA